MTDTETTVSDPNEAIRLRLIGRARALNGAVLSRFAIAADDLEGEFHLRALGALDGVEIEIQNLKTLLRLIEG